MTRTEIAALITQKLASESSAVESQWRNPAGTNTRHFVIDGLLPQEFALRVYEAFPKDAKGFYERNSFRERKRTSANLSQFPPILTELTYAIQSPPVIELIAQLVGMDALEPDPLLYAGGLSMMFQGDFLNPHIDNSHDSARRRYRRLNLLYYVSPEWQLESGGNLELWNEKRTRPKTIASSFNRLAVMETNRNSWHSVSPVRAERPRCCVSNYFFSRFAPHDTEYFHVTSFTGRPDEKFKRAWGALDNSLRNILSRYLRIGRGRNLVNKQ